MEIHKILQRQLASLSLDKNELPTNLEKWQEFIFRVNKAYLENDQDRYLLNRSMEISSREMLMLNEKLENAQKIARLCYWQYDGKTEYIFGSNELFHIFNLNPVKPATYEDFLVLLHEDDRKKLKKMMKKSLSNKSNFECEIRLNTEKKNYHWYRVIARYQEKEKQLSGVIIDINNDKRVEKEINLLNQKLLSTARRAGMSEVATTILHNIGNVLNSANISISLIKENLDTVYYQKLCKVISMFKEHSHDLADFLTYNNKGKLLPDYLLSLTELITKNYLKNIEEMKSIERDIEHIKTIVSTQKSLGGSYGISEIIFIPDLIETALKISLKPAQDKLIDLSKKYYKSLNINADKSKLLQILINLIQNAKDAVLESKEKTKEIKVIVDGTEKQKVDIRVSDNGVGIAPEHIDRIFSFGFTTKETGHGFGLHSSALSAQDMGGNLKAESQGLGKGATFILTLPTHKNPSKKGIFNE